MTSSEGEPPPVEPPPTEPAPRRRPMPYPPGRDPRSLRRRRQWIAAAALGALLIAGGVIAIFALNDDDKPASQAGASPTLTVTQQTTLPTSALPNASGCAAIDSTSAAPTPKPSPTARTSTKAGASSTGRTSTTPASVTASAACTVVEAYLRDVNARDKAAAGALICASHHAVWEKNADSPNGDFAFTVTDAVFDGSQPATSTTGVVVSYSLHFSDGTSNQVRFTVVDEGGAKICGTS